MIFGVVGDGGRYATLLADGHLGGRREAGSEGDADGRGNVGGRPAGGKKREGGHGGEGCKLAEALSLFFGLNFGLDVGLDFSIRDSNGKCSGRSLD